jgi:hypothetical protein
MRKGALLIALVFAASAAAATAASAAKKAAKPDPAIQAQKESAAFFDDALHPWAPSSETKAKGKKKK